MLDIKFIKTRDVKDPHSAFLTSAGIDFFVPNDFEKTILIPGTSICIPSGIKVIVPKGHAGIFFNKSGIGKKGIHVGAQVVDEDYRGEVHIDIHNVSTFKIFNIEPGQKIIQMLIIPTPYYKISKISEKEFNDDVTARGSGGFGSTGEK